MAKTSTMDTRDTTNDNNPNPALGSPKVSALVRALKLGEVPKGDIQRLTAAIAECVGKTPAMARLYRHTSRAPAAVPGQRSMRRGQNFGGWWSEPVIDRKGDERATSADAPLETPEQTQARLRAEHDHSLVNQAMNDVGLSDMARTHLTDRAHGLLAEWRELRRYGSSMSAATYLATNLRRLATEALGDY